MFVGLKEYQGRWLIFSSWLLQSGLSLIVHAAWLQSLELRFPQVQEGILTRKVKAPRIVLGRQEHPARTELFPTKLTCRVRAKAAYVFGRHSMFWCFGSGGTEAPLQVKQIRGFQPHLKRFCSLISLATTGSKLRKDKLRRSHELHGFPAHFWSSACGRAHVWHKMARNEFTTQSFSVRVLI